MALRTAPLRRYLSIDGLYDLDAMRADAAAYAERVRRGQAIAGHPLAWRDERGVVFNLADWDAAIREAEASNAAGGRGFSPAGGPTEWDLRGSRTGE